MSVTLDTPIGTSGPDIEEAVDAAAVAEDFRFAVKAETLPVYVDSRAADDSGDGRTPTTPKKTLAAAVALLSAGGRLLRACGSRWHETWPETPFGVTTDSYGQGVRPIHDGSRALSGWTAHATASGVYQVDVTITQTVYNPPSNRWHPMLWDESENSDLDSCRQTYYHAGATVADNIEYVRTHPGTFTVQKIGGTNPFAPEDTGTQFRYFFHPADSSNPAANGRTVYHVDQGGIGLFSAGLRVYNADFRRNGGKDFLGVPGGAVKPERFENCRFLEHAVHGPVSGGTEFVDCFAYGQPTARTSYGASFHNFRAESTDGVSLGCRFIRCYAKQSATGFYSHGTGVGDPEHEYFDVLDCTAELCDNPVVAGETVRPPRVENLTLIDCGNAVYNYGTKKLFLKNVHGTVQSGGVGIGVGGADIDGLQLIRTLDYGATVDWTAFAFLGSSGSADVAVRNSTVLGNGTTQFTAVRALNIHFENCVLVFAEDSRPIWSGTVTAENTAFCMASKTESEMRTSYPGIEDDCVFPIREQVNTYEVTLEDIRYYGTRQATYSGTGNTLVFDYLDSNSDNMRGIKVVDAYGTGSHYYGVVDTIVSQGTVGGSLTVVTPPVSAFSNKVCQFGHFNKQTFPAADDIVSIKGDGLKIATDELHRYSEGLAVRVADPLGRKPARAAVITDITGDVVTFDRGDTWQQNASSGYKPITGGNGLALPTTAVGFGFTILRGSTTLSIDPVEGGSAIVMTEDLGTCSPATYPVNTTTGADGYFGTYHYDEGFIDYGPFVAIGDTITFTSKAIIDPWLPQWETDPLHYRETKLQPGTELSIRRMGYR